MSKRKGDPTIPTSDRSNSSFVFRSILAVHQDPKVLSRDRKTFRIILSWHPLLASWLSNLPRFPGDLPMICCCFLDPLQGLYSPFTGVLVSSLGLLKAPILSLGQFRYRSRFITPGFDLHDLPWVVHLNILGPLAGLTHRTQRLSRF